MSLNFLGKILLDETRKTTKVKPNRPSRDDIRVVGETLLGEGANRQTNALGVRIGERERPIQGGLDHSGNVLLVAILLVEEGKHLGVVLADAATGEANDLLLGLAGGTRTAKRHRVVECALHKLGVVSLLHLRSNLAVLNVGGVAPHEPLGGRPQLDALARTPTTTSMTIDVEGGDTDFGANVVSLATELATLVDHHSHELLHLDHSFGSTRRGLPIPHNTYIIAYQGAESQYPLGKYSDFSMWS